MSANRLDTGRYRGYGVPMTNTATQCQALVQPRVSRGIMARGTESTMAGPMRLCSRKAIEGGALCATHQRQQDAIERALEQRRAAR